MASSSNMTFSIQKNKYQNIFDFFNSDIVAPKIYKFLKENIEYKDNNGILIIECFIGLNKDNIYYVLGSNTTVFHDSNSIYLLNIIFSPSIFDQQNQNNILLNDKNHKFRFYDGSEKMNNSFKSREKIDIIEMIKIIDVYIETNNEEIKDDIIFNEIYSNLIRTSGANNINKDLLVKASNNINVNKLKILNKEDQVYYKNNFEPLGLVIFTNNEVNSFLKIMVKFCEQWSETYLAKNNSIKDNFYYINKLALDSMVSNTFSNENLGDKFKKDLIYVFTNIDALFEDRLPNLFNWEEQTEYGIIVTKYWLNKLKEQSKSEKIDQRKILLSTSTQIYFDLKNIDKRNDNISPLHRNYINAFYYILNYTFEYNKNDCINKISNIPKYIDIFQKSISLYKFEGLIKSIKNIQNEITSSFTINNIFENISKYHGIVEINNVYPSDKQKMLKLSKLSYFCYNSDIPRIGFSQKLELNFEKIQTSFLNHRSKTEFVWLLNFLKNYYFNFNYKSIPNNILLIFIKTNKIDLSITKAKDIRENLLTIINDFDLNDSNDNKKIILTKNTQYVRNLYAFILSLNKIYSFFSYYDYAIKTMILKLIIKVPDGFEIDNIKYTIDKLDIVDTINGYYNNPSQMMPYTILHLLFLEIYEINKENSIITKSDNNNLGTEKKYMISLIQLIKYLSMLTYTIINESIDNLNNNLNKVYQQTNNQSFNNFKNSLKLVSNISTNKI